MPTPTTPSAREPHARPATIADAMAIAPVLARAFHVDPIFLWLLPDEGSRPARLTRLFAAVARHMYLPHGASFTFDGHEGAALWAPPRTAPLTASSALLLGPDVLRALGGSVLRGGRLLSAVARHHPRQPYHYLGVLGVDPAFQGRGLSTRLLRPTLDRADAEGTPCFLETATESNVSLYRRFGFDVTRELRLPGAPVVWLMTRPPRARDR